MGNIFVKIKDWVKEHRIATFFIVAVLLAAGYFGYVKLNPVKVKVSYVTEAAAANTITSSVSGSGQISESNSIDLKPLYSATGAITELDIKQGDQVKAGQTVAVIDQRDNLTALNKASASLASAQANYEQVKAGATQDDLKASQLSLNQAQNSYNNSLVSLQNTKDSIANNIAQTQKTLTDLQDTTNQASPNNKRGVLLTTIVGKISLANSALDTENKIFNDTNIKPSLAAQDSSALISAKNSYNQAVSLMSAANSSTVLAQASRTDSNMSQAANDLVNALNKISDSLNSCFDSLQATIPSTTITQSQIDSYKSSISGQISSINSAISNVQSASQDLKDALISAQNALTNAQLSANQQLASANNQVQSASTSLESAKNNLAKLQEPPLKQNVNSAYSQVVSAQAQLQVAQDAYKNNVIAVPFDGQVAALNSQLGDQVGQSTVIATIISNQKVAVIPLNEVDVVNVKLGQQAMLTFDAINGLTLTGKVSQIDSLGTVSQGVVTYNVKIALESDDPRVKPDMSTNVEIITNVKTDVLAVPNAAVKTDNLGTYVQVLDANGQPQKVSVEIGLANDTYTEIISGLNEGDKVVTQTVTASPTTTTPTQASGLNLLTGGATRTGGFSGGGGATRPTTGGGAATRGN